MRLCLEGAYQPSASTPRVLVAIFIIFFYYCHLSSTKDITVKKEKSNMEESLGAIINRKMTPQKTCMSQSPETVNALSYRAKSLLQM